MDDKGVEEVPKEEMEVEDEGDDVVEVTSKGKRKKPIVKVEKRTRVRKPNKLFRGLVENSSRVIKCYFDK